MTLLTTAFAQGTHAARPAAAAGNAGYYYFETDTTNLFQSTGSAWTQVGSVSGGGGGTTEYDYVAITSPVSVTATTDATANAVIDGNAVTYDGSTRIKLEFHAPIASSPVGQEMIFVLYDGATDLGRFADAGQGSQVDVTIYAAQFLTPSAAAHTYHVKAWVTGGTGTVAAGAGGAGVKMPAWYRITKA